MAEENKLIETEAVKKTKKVKKVATIKPEEKKEEQKTGTAPIATPVQAKPEEKKQEQKAETKVEEKKEEKKKEEIKKKDYAIVNGNDLPISTKESMDVCSMIRGRNIETAIKMLEEVIAFKRVVKMNKREVPHQKGKGVMAGRYPINASNEFIRLLKQLNANAIVNGLEIEKCKIFCKANFASRPYKRGGAKFKRTHVVIKLETPKIKQNKNKK
jgi:ribosomal protein L22